MKFGIVILLFMLGGHGAVWTADKLWSSENERLYSDWVGTNWKNDIFTNPNSDLYGLKTDCADASYAMRAYYAFLNKLPFSFHRFDGVVLTHSMINFDGTKDSIARFRAFLGYVFDVTDTRTLSLDTYPIAINRQALRAGVLYVSPGIHSYQIIGLDEYGIPETLSSTVPREERLLFSHHGFPFYVPGDTKKYSDGFRAFKSYSNEISTEQFEIASHSAGVFISYQKMMIQKTRLNDEPFDRRIRRIKGNLCFFSRERAVMVADAFVKLQSQKGACFGRVAFDDYSTYIRDKKLKNYFNEFKKMTREPAWQETPLEAKKMLLSAFLPEVPDEDCIIETSLLQRPFLRLSDIHKALEEGKIVSDPNATMMQRWGLDSYTPHCPIF